MQTPNGPSLLSTLTTRARAMRKAPTPSEAKMWSALRMRRLGVRFRRQHSLPPYFVDFYCAAHKLVVEVDGGIHRTSEHRLADAHREAELVRLYGVRIVRVDAELVTTNISAALAIVLGALR